MLDVAAVADVLLRRCVPSSVAASLLNPGLAVRLEAKQLAWLIALHDLGKVSPGFQQKVPMLADELRHAQLPFPTTAETNHGQLTLELLPSLLVAQGLDEEEAELAASAVGAHHGTFPRYRDRAPARDGGAPWDQLRSASVHQLAAAIGAAPVTQLGGAPDTWLMLLSGLCVVADWVGSNIDFFRYGPTRRPDAQYWQDSLATAERATTELGLETRAQARPTEDPAQLFARLFPHIPQPNAMQQAALELVGSPSGPGLLLVEAPTGMGKTEAALAAAETWQQAGFATGVYYALPTQATSNQMYGRLRQFLAHRNEGGRTNLLLLHGNRDLQPEFRQARHAAIYDAQGAVVADEWFLGRKRGLMSAQAVGTVDQAMLAALVARHFFVRMFALAGKTVVIDEVHAYDTYMSRILDRLLEWLSVLGSPVVLLSATLPPSRREALLAAYLGHPVREAGSEQIRYPRLALAHRGSGETTAVHCSGGAQRAVQLERWPDDPACVAGHLSQQVQDGGCAAWICNTVGRAQGAFRALVDAGFPASELTLFHARFPLGRRASIEADLLGRFSREGRRPQRHIVVATQVVEQSLDLDFDFMATDLAPIDLMLQRMGRLQRHDRSRPAAFADTTLAVVGPSRVEGAGAFGASGYVYDPAILLRTWVALHGVNSILVPQDIDPLIASVYERPGQGTLAALQVDDLDAQLQTELAKRQQASMAAARRVLVPTPNGADRFVDRLSSALDDSDDPTLHPDVRAATREIGPTVTVVCLHRRQDELRTPSGDRVDLEEVPDRQTVRALIDASLTLQHPGLVKQLAGSTPAAWRQSALLRYAAPLVLEDDTWSAGRHELRLDPTLGLEIAG